MGRKLMSVFLTVWILFMLPMAASAHTFEYDHPGSITVTLMDPDGKTPISGAELSLFHVATVSLNSYKNLSYNFTAPFQYCGFGLDDPELSAKLEEFIEEQSPSATKLVTNDQGCITFSNLPLGLYFIRQTNTVKGYAPCTSFLVTVPNPTSDGYVYDVNASPKTDVAKLTDITIKKVWNTGKTSGKTESITVELLKHGTVIQRAELSDENNWQFTFTDMPQSDGYSIEEVDVPNGFTATYSENGYVFTVTNTASLAQTGQLIWPIPVLAMAGLFLIVLGTIVLRRTGNKNA